MAARVLVDADLCAGTMECVRVAPLAFRIDEDTGTSVPLEDAQWTDVGLLLAAERDCPTGAIRVWPSGDDRPLSQPRRPLPR